MNKQQAKVAKMEAATRELMDLRRTITDGDRWRHVRSGGVYVVRGLALREADLTPCVLYVPTTGALRVTWVRPAKEFLDGRFTFLGEAEE